MIWMCDHCYHEMDVTKEGPNRYRVECSNCGTYWFVDKYDEMINDGSAWSPDDDDEECEDESLNVYDAAQIWASHGKDEDYMFGYTEEQLEEAL